MTPRLFVDASGIALAEGASVVLPEPAAHHAMRVLRLREGDALTLFDGTGGGWRATIAAAGRRDATVAIGAHDPVERESPFAATLVVSTLATDAMDYAVRKAVELGAAAIVPVVAARSQGASRGDRRVEHWRKIAVAACEQCGRNRVPPVGLPQPLRAWLAARDPDRPGVVLAPAGEATLAGMGAALAIDVLVGPEGGFDDAEIASARKAGLRAVAMGPRVLKAETACVAALAALQALRGDLR